MVDLTKVLKQDAMPLPSTAYPWRLHRRSLLLLPLLFASCMAPKENGLDPFKGGLMAELLMSFQPTVLATSGSTITELSAGTLQPTGTLITVCATPGAIATDSAGWRLIIGCAPSLIILDRRELPGRSVNIGATSIGTIVYDESTQIAVAIDASPTPSVVAVDTRTATMLWKQTFSDTPNSLAILSGRVLVGFSTTATPPYLKAFDLRTGADAGSFTSGNSGPTTNFIHSAALPDKSGFVSVEYRSPPTSATLRLHDAQTLQPIWEADVSSQFTSQTLDAMAVNQQDGVVYVANDTAGLHFFDLNSGAFITTVFTNTSTLAYSRFMNRLYAVQSPPIYALDPLTGAQLAVSGMLSPTGIAVIPGDRY